MSIIGEISTIDSPRSTFWSKYRSYRGLALILGEISSTAQRNVDVMRIILTGQCKTCIWITPSPYNHHQCLSSWAFCGFWRVDRPPCYAAVRKQGGPGPVARIRRKSCYEHDTDTRNNSRQCQWTPFTIPSLFGTVRHNLTAFWYRIS